MTIFQQLNLSKTTSNSIEWKMTPDLAFCTFSAKGLRDDLKNTSERVCYFFIDNWGKIPKLYLMERGVRHVNILAEINAPLAILQDCIIRQGGKLSSRNNYPVDTLLKKWLIREVVEADDCPYLLPMVEEKKVTEDMGPTLPETKSAILLEPAVTFPPDSGKFDDAQVNELLREWNFYDAVQNPAGQFTNTLTTLGNKPVVVDVRTAIMWQQEGIDLCSIRRMRKEIEQLNQQTFAGYNDWRLPSLAEALSIMEQKINTKGLHTASCFSIEQPFIFVAARRLPTGYWFVDYKQGKVYWSSGTVPGGFARLCRNITRNG